ncbi:MAG: PAS domain-containing protein [Rhodospirillaceae bacterium]|nr:PAS domain-containing protein [Rhodospirillaceae bacterium]
MPSRLSPRLEGVRMSPEDVARPHLCEVFAYWNALRGDEPVPRRDAFDPIRVKPSLGLISIAEVLRGGEDFRYLLYGSELARVQDQDFTGRLVSELPPPEFGRFVLSHLREAIAEGKPTAYRIEVVSDRMSIDYWRLLLPFCGESGGIGEVMSICDLDREFWTAVSSA